MPEPASSRSLEDILASIRRSLADESVDGLVELSEAAVDAARAEQARSGATPMPAAPRPSGPEDAAPVSAADALADELLRDKLAGALVLETEVGEEEPAGDDDFAPANDTEAQAEPQHDSGALAKLWVLRPGIDHATPTAPTSGGSLSLDPFAGVRLPSADNQPPADFSLSPLELIGGASPLAKPLPVSPQSSQAPAREAPASAAPAPAAEGAGPPRLDAANIALLQKLRASNAAAIEKMAQSIVESGAAPAAIPTVPEPEPVTAGAESDVDHEAPTVAPFAELLKSVAKAEPDPAPEHTPVTSGERAAEAPAPEPAAAPETLEEEARPLLSLPERSTPLFGDHGDARPQLTSGLDHLLPETGAAPLQVADIGLPEPGPESVPSEASETPVAARVDEPVDEGEAPQAFEAAEPIQQTVVAEIAEPELVDAASEEAPAMTAAPAPGNKALEGRHDRRRPGACSAAPDRDQYRAGPRNPCPPRGGKGA